MASIHKVPDTYEKLKILSQDAQYDIACACGTKDEHRKRSKEDKWIYPVAMPSGGKRFLFKTLLSNHCTNQCKYCRLRINNDSRRCSLQPEEVAKTFFNYFRQGKVMGLFLSSGVMGSPDATMARINRAAWLLRKNYFRGYIHLKVIPGASEAAVRESVALSSAVSLNIEAASEKHFAKLCPTKNYQKDIIDTMRLIKRLTAAGTKYAGVRQTTQFIIGAAAEKDKEILASVKQLYQDIKLNRIYFSAYQRGGGTNDLYGENSTVSNADMLMREHRLYQVDWLLRKYKFKPEEIPFNDNGELSLTIDPKEMWAKRHPEYFPVNINKASHFQLLRVPGLGEISVRRILFLRSRRQLVHNFAQIGLKGKRLAKVQPYVVW